MKVLGGGSFYRRPLAGLPIRVGAQLVGVNNLKTIIKVICARGGLKGNNTNYSGKRTCATQLYMAGVDEQEIMERTGHRSEKSVRKYKTANSTILGKVAAVLDPPEERAEEKHEKSVGEMDSKRPKLANNPLGDI